MRRSGLPAFVLAALSFTLAREARADLTKAQCIAEDTAGQNERRATHFRAAKEHLEACSRQGCPPLVRDDCNQRLADLDATMPTVVFAVKDAAGDDVVGVRVTIDGGPTAIDVAGAGIPVDPGVHTFRFVVAGATPVEKKLVVHEGEKARQEKVTFPDLNAGSRPVAPPIVAVAPANAVAPSESSWNGQKTSAVVVGGVGALGVVAGAIFGALSFSAWSSSQSDCGTSNCADHAGAVSQRNSAATDATVSDVGFAAGGALVVGGLVLFLTARSAPPEPARSSSSGSAGAWRLLPTVSMGGGGMSLSGRF